jgi:dihydrofolate synthase / folylpolyglutamate synthase
MAAAPAPRAALDLGVARVVAVLDALNRPDAA